jgi:sulfopropanediol 3-dehydrogenase
MADTPPSDERHAEHLKSAQRQLPAVTQQVRHIVSEILHDVERRREHGLRRWSAKLDNWSPERFRVAREEIEAPSLGIDDELRANIDTALAHLRGFAEHQRATLTDLEVQTSRGVTLGHRHIPVGAVDSYSPGGRYALVASSIMTGAVPHYSDRGRLCEPDLKSLLVRGSGHQLIRPAAGRVSHEASFTLAGLTSRLAWSASSS